MGGGAGHVHRDGADEPAGPLPRGRRQLRGEGASRGGCGLSASTVMYSDASEADAVRLESEFVSSPQFLHANGPRTPRGVASNFVVFALRAQAARGELFVQVQRAGVVSGLLLVRFPREGCRVICALGVILCADRWK